MGALADTAVAQRVPHPRPRGPRLPRQLGDVADAAHGHRRDDRLLREPPRERAPRRVPARRSRRPSCSRARASASRGSSAGACRETIFTATRPRRSTSSRGRGARRTSAPATRASSPRWSTTRTSCRGSSCASARARRSTGCRWTTTGGSSSTRSTRSSRRGDVKLVAVAHVSNVVGTINPVADIVRRAHAAGAVVVVDGSQAVPQLPVDLREIDADFYAWTGHKAYGPTGIGILHGRRELLDAMPPFISGGHMIASVVARQGHALCDDAREVRGRHVGDRRGHRPRRRGRLPVGHRHGRGARARARPRRLRDRAPGGGARAARSRARSRLPTVARWCRSRSTACTRTTSPRSSALAASASAPATTARSR